MIDGNIKKLLGFGEKLHMVSSREVIEFLRALPPDDQDLEIDIRNSGSDSTDQAVDA